jgi:hypothetical protein
LSEVSIYGIVRLRNPQSACNASVVVHLLHMALSNIELLLCHDQLPTKYTFTTQASSAAIMFHNCFS